MDEFSGYGKTSPSTSSSSSSSLASFVSTQSQQSTPLPPPPPTPISSVQQQPKLTQNQNSQSLLNTIPLYQVQQSSSEAISSLNANSSMLVFQNQDNNSSAPEFGTNFANSSQIVRPVSRISYMNRRQCKSTSDETFTHEINKLSSSSSNQYNLDLLNANRNTLNINNNNANIELDLSIRSHNSNDCSNLKSLSSGRFGVNPLTLSFLSANLLNNNSKKNANYSKWIANRSSPSGHLNSKSFIGFNSKNRDNNSNSSYINSNSNKKNVKRLSGLNCHARPVYESKHRKSNESHNKKLFQAVSNNDYESVVELLDSSMYDVNCLDDKQRTCLHIASSRGHLDIVRVLLNYGASPNMRDCVGNLPIHLAIIASHVPIVTLLLESGTDIHSLDVNGKTVLHLAGTRLRWLLSDDNSKASSKLKFEAIMIMNMIKEYLRRKQNSTVDLDMLANKLESVFNIDDVNSVTKELLSQFDTLNLA